MADFLLRIKNCVTEKQKTCLTQTDLVTCGLTGIELRPYQLDGIRWLTQCQQNQQGCILGDEMGLGKTCQTISMLVFISGSLGVRGPFLVLSPLSVIENWRRELQSFSPALSVLHYNGDKERRAELQREALTLDFNVLLTTYELCLKDVSFLKRWSWEILIVDEAHRLKNQNSLLHKALIQLSVGFRVLLTGTPIQNNLQELYSLLSFIQPDVFSAEEADAFTGLYGDVQSQPTLAAELQKILDPFLLRRVKSEVAVDLPKKTELLLYHGMSALQKKYYKALLMKDPEAFGKKRSNKNKLLNILMNLRKCVAHPYLFDGVEPEPFKIGEHLVKASGKLCLLDDVLAHLHKKGHRVLLFSQMTRMLDIIQDYMQFRGYSYERLDGSVRGEERNLAVKNFSSKDIFVFLLSTKAGGVGLNLTAADTVIFMDSDFNPQNDLQAAARCHRIGQSRPVKVIRLLARDTVEEIMYSRASSKLQLCNTVIEKGRFSLLHQAQCAAAGLQLSEILKFGVDKLLATEESSVTDMKLEKILGSAEDVRWAEEEKEEEEEIDVEGSVPEPDRQNHMYYFEGRDYSRDPSTEDQKTFNRLLEEQPPDDLNIIHLSTGGAEGTGGAAWRKEGAFLSFLETPTRKRKSMTEADQEFRHHRQEEAAAKIVKIQEDAKKEQELKKKMAWWESCGYRSRCLPLADSEEEEKEKNDIDVCATDGTAMRYVLGDVTHPQTAHGDAIIVHCVDDSGRWGRGGLFSALEVRSDEPRQEYELAGKMKDLDVGNVLLLPIDDKQSRITGRDQLALIVAQRRDKNNKLSGILLTALDDGLKKICAAAKRSKASVHLPRIGHATRGFNWYGTERLIRKHLASRGIPTFIYYHNRAAKNPPPPLVPTSSSGPTDDEADSGAPGPSAPPPGPSAPPPGPSAPPPGDPALLPDFMSGVRVFFFNLAASDRKRLGRYLVTYDGDEDDVMSPEVTHIVAEVESGVQSQELQGLAVRFCRAVPVQTGWLESCFSRQRRVSEEPFLQPLP